MPTVGKRMQRKLALERLSEFGAYGWFVINQSKRSGSTARLGSGRKERKKLECGLLSSIACVAPHQLTQLISVSMNRNVPVTLQTPDC
jgi:hypothetical protein